MDQAYFDKELFAPEVDVARYRKGAVAAISEELETKTDLVDDALYFGIKARFNKYLDAMADLKTVEELVDDQLRGIAKLRGTYGDFRHALGIIKDKVVAKKKLVQKKRAVLEILSMFEQINLSLNLIEQSIAKKEFNEAVASYKKQEEVLFNKLKGYCLSEKFEAKLNATRTRMIAECCRFLKASLDGYLGECFQFSTKKVDGTGDTSRLIQEMTLIANSSMNMSMDISILERFEHNSVPLYLMGTFEPTKKAEIEELATMLSNFLSIKDFKVEGLAEEVSAAIRVRVREVNV